MKILISGYPYVRENFLNTFNAISDDCVFLLPRTWKAKDGKVIFNSPQRNNVIPATTLFYHSHYPVIGGLLKGWMPVFPVVLWQKRHEISVVYTPLEPTLLSTLYQAFWTKALGKKHIIFTWENVPYTKFKGFNWAVKYLILKANILLSDGFVCGNRKAQDILSAYTIKPIAVIPLSGLDVEFYASSQRDLETENKYHLASKITFSFIGALSYRKGIHLILEALKISLSKIPSAHLIIVGSGEYESEIKIKISELALGDQVTIIPWADAEGVRHILSFTDVFLYPSIAHGGWEEQFGYSIAEAMAMAVPVISTHSGSIEDIVMDGKTGLLIKPDDSRILADAMTTLGLDSGLRKEMGQAGREYITQHYSYPIIAEKFYEFFKKITLSR